MACDGYSKTALMGNFLVSMASLNGKSDKREEVLKENRELE